MLTCPKRTSFRSVHYEPLNLRKRVCCCLLQFPIRVGPFKNFCFVCWHNHPEKINCKMLVIFSAIESRRRWTLGTLKDAILRFVFVENLHDEIAIDMKHRYFDSRENMQNINYFIFCKPWKIASQLGHHTFFCF